MRDLKNTVEVEKHCIKEQGPVYVTKNGYGRLAVIEGLKYLKEANTKAGADTIRKLKEKYEL